MFVFLLCMFLFFLWVYFASLFCFVLFCVSSVVFRFSFHRSEKRERMVVDYTHVFISQSHACITRVSDQPSDRSIFEQL